MNIKLEKVYNIMEFFKEIHTSNSKYLGDDDYFELLSPKNKPDGNYNSNFLEAKDLILKKFPREMLLKEDSFIIYSKHLYIFISYHLSEESSPLPLRTYLNFLESSKDYLDYIKNLRANTFHLTIFKLDCLNGFCNDIVSDYMDDFINIKEMEYENKYLYSKPKDFQEIESLWKDGKYDNSVIECRNSLLYFIDKYQEARNGKRLNTEKRKNSDKIDFSKNEGVFEEFLEKVCVDYEIKELKKCLEVIIKNFGEIRNDFKGQPNLSLDDKEIEVLYKKINTRMVIDLCKAIHNLLVLLINEKIKD